MPLNTLPDAGGSPLPPPSALGLVASRAREVSDLDTRFGLQGFLIPLSLLLFVASTFIHFFFFCSVVFSREMKGTSSHTSLERCSGGRKFFVGVSLTLYPLSGGGEKSYCCEV